MSEDLKRIRQELDEIDRRLLEALSARHRIIDRVASLKSMSEAQIRDLQREEEIVRRLSEAAKAAGLDPYYVGSLFQKILDYSVRYQTDYLADRQNPGRTAERVVVAYQGSEGAHSHLAALHHFSSRSVELAYHGYASDREAAEAVEAGDADYAVLAIENTSGGSINETYDLLGQRELSLVGEEVLKIEHCLVALEPVPLRLIRRIAAHPQAIAQCSAFLSTLHDCHVESYLDTAVAVKKIRDDRDLSEAAIASAEAAERYGLHVLKADIANQKENYTRFVIVAKEPVHYDLRIACKTSLIFAVPHEQGALMRCLGTFVAHDLNLTKLESRPRRETPWEYLFYVDFEGNIDDEKVSEAMKELSEQAGHLKVLGSYPMRTTARDTAIAPSRTAEDLSRLL